MAFLPFPFCLFSHLLILSWGIYLSFSYPQFTRSLDREYSGDHRLHCSPHHAYMYTFPLFVPEESPSTLTSSPFIFPLQFARQSRHTVWSTLWGSPSLPSTPNTTQPSSQSNFSGKYLEPKTLLWFCTIFFSGKCSLFSSGFVFCCSLIDLLSSDDHQPMHP